MKRPPYIQMSDKIGVTATSDGNQKELDLIRLENGRRQFLKRGYQIIETDNVRCSENGRSGSGKSRAEQFMSLVKREEITWIIAARGGDFLCEMLSYIDYKELQSHAKWIQGYSDTTGILFSITTNCEIMTIYGSNFSDYGMEKWHSSLEQGVRILQGENKALLQKSFDRCEDGFSDRITGMEGYDLVKDVCWKNMRGEENITMQGRLLGGCIDVLLNLVGTRLDHTVEFVQKYKEEGILWYLESFDLTAEALIRGLWQLKEAGWFQHAGGFIFGRPMLFRSDYDYTYEEAVQQVLGDLNLPIILEADIGHKAPRLTMINGALAEVYSAGGGGHVKIIL